MDSNIIELVKLGHERADELKAACGAVDVRSVTQLISDLASQLEVQYVRAEESQREFRSADITMQNMEAKCAALAAENAGMDAFVDALLSIAWQGGSADGAEIQELALKHGLLRQEVYSADEHENQVDDPGNFEDGDPVYFRVETPATDAFMAEVRAQESTDFIGCIEWIIRNECNPDKTETILNELHAFAAHLHKGDAL